MLASERIEWVSTWVLLPVTLVGLLPAAAGQLALTTRIPVGREPTRAIAAGAETFVSNSGDSTISVIAGRTETVVATIPVAPHPDAIVASPDGSRIYVGHADDQGRGGVSVIDTTARRVLAFITTRPSPVWDLALTPDGKKLYIATRDGLKKLEVGKYVAEVVDSTLCPTAVVISPDGTRAYVNYQCAPLPGTWGHDPIRVFDLTADRPLRAIFQFPDGKPIPNVGGPMAMSSDGMYIWANGSDACSRRRTTQDPQGYDFEGCPCLNRDEDALGRGVINIIDVQRAVLLEAFSFRGQDVGKKSPLGASTPTFLPSGHLVAVGTASRLLIFDSENLNQVAAFDGIPGAGKIAFPVGRNLGYVPVRGDNSVRVLQIGPGPGLTSRFLSWYFDKWQEAFVQTLGYHISALIVLWGFLSVPFARVFGQIPILRLPLEFDVYWRKHRSRLVRLYLSQLRGSSQRTLERTEASRIVALPLRSNGTGGLTTESWASQFAQKARCKGSYRVAMKGRGGTGKTIFIHSVVVTLIENGCVPVVLLGAGYEGDPLVDSWTEKAMKRARVPLSAHLIGTLPSAVYLVDQASEVPVEHQVSFWKLVKSQFEPAVADIKLFLAGRFVEIPGTTAGLAWEEVLEPDELEDDDIRALGSSYLDATGNSVEVQNLPADVKGFMGHPSAFIVSHYAKAKRSSSRRVTSSQELFGRILDAHVNEGQFGTRPDVVKEILQALVGLNFLTTGNRGLPLAVTLREQVRGIITDRHLTEIYGHRDVSEPGSFVDRMLSSGLVYSAGTRYLFFHDAFEDWLADEVGQAGQAISVTGAS